MRTRLEDGEDRCGFAGGDSGRTLAARTSARTPKLTARRLLLCLPALLPIIAAGGCHSCPWLQPREPKAPIVFATPPGLNELIAAVNNNSGRIRQLQTTSARLSAEGFPGLQADIAYEQPRRFRLRAQLPVFGTGQQLDMGSNDEIFWVWVNDEVLGMRLQSGPRSPVYYARHDEFNSAAMRDVIPIEPRWVIDMLGLVQLDPAAAYDGPYATSPDRLELRTRVPTPGGEMLRVISIHRQYGWVLEQNLYDSSGLVASAKASRHRYYETEGVSLPRLINVQVAPGRPGQMAFQVEVGDYLVNQLIGDPAQLWQPPEQSDRPLVNLADLQSQNSVSPPPRPVPPTPGMSYRPQYRGVDKLR